MSLSTAEQLALAVLRGDEIAASALADEVCLNGTGRGVTKSDRPILLPRGGSGTAPPKLRPKTPAEVTEAANDWAVERFNEEIHDNLEPLPYELSLPEMANADEVAARLQETGWMCELAVRTSAYGTSPPFGFLPYPVLVVRRAAPKPCWWCRGNGRSSDGSMPCQICGGGPKGEP